MSVYGLIVILIVVGALAFIIRTYFKRTKKEGVGCCGCSACSADPVSCDSPEKPRAGSEYPCKPVSRALTEGR
ncbi:MAG: FeoB-associated Cys-rich membrane protein [Deltaproteobacteria bacterium]|nr:FeoB-associated Cys-rich membrane protein [Deltaproteobacteria bacterium]MBW2353797.1 FeoB-associated Cys-rich membrane protein [Deltaproteobacteria bacterium]